MVEALDGMDGERFLGEPQGRDTLNALAYSTAVIRKKDPDAVIAVFTADHLIEPADKFRLAVEAGFRAAESHENILVTFGITPGYAATGFGYLELGDSLGEDLIRLERFREKPDAESAAEYLDAGPGRYLWNSGMFVWHADTLLKCVGKYEPETYSEISRIADSAGTPDFDAVLEEVYDGLKKISIDYAVMEPASADPEFTVAAVPMDLDWKDIGSWTAFSRTLEPDTAGNIILSGEDCLEDSSGNILYSSDGSHLIAGIGIDDLIVVHTDEATLICPKDRDQDLKALYNAVKEKYGDRYV